MDARGESIAHLLQLSEAERARLAGHRADASVEPQAGKSLDDESAQLAFEAADLAPQLGAGKALVDLYTRGGKAISV